MGLYYHHHHHYSPWYEYKKFQLFFLAAVSKADKKPNFFFLCGCFFGCLGIGMRERERENSRSAVERERWSSTTTDSAPKLTSSTLSLSLFLLFSSCPFQRFNCLLFFFCLVMIPKEKKLHFVLIYKIFSNIPLQDGVIYPKIAEIYVVLYEVYKLLSSF